MSLSSLKNLSFYEPDFKKFPALKLGWEALENPNCSPIVLNASNEVAVDFFLKNKIRFTDIYKFVDKTLDFYSPNLPQNIEDVIEIDKIARLHTLEFIKKVI